MSWLSPGNRFDEAWLGAEALPSGLPEKARRGSRSHMAIFRQLQSLRDDRPQGLLALALRWIAPRQR